MITWSELEKQNLQAQKVYREENSLHHVGVVANYLEYSLGDNHTVKLSFQSTSMHVIHSVVSIKCCIGKDMIWFSSEFMSLNLSD